MINQRYLEKALPIVATAYGEQFGVNVVLSGSDARTDGKTIILPLLDNMSEMKDVLFGYLAHESGHVRDSDFTIPHECTPIEHNFTNIIEDIRIETLMQEVFPGTLYTLDTSWTYIIEKGLSAASKPEDNEASQLSMYLLHRLRLEYLNQQSSKELYEESKAVVEETFPKGFFVRLNGLLSTYMEKLTCTRDCLLLARAVLKALKEAEEEENQNSDDSSKDNHEQNGNSSEADSNNKQPDNANSDNGEANQDKNPLQGDSNNQPGQSSSSDSSSSASAKDKAEKKATPLHDKLVKETSLPADAIDKLKSELKEKAKESNAQYDGTGHGSFSIRTSGAGDEATNTGITDKLQNGILASSAIRSRLMGLLQAQSLEDEWLHSSGKKVDGSRLSRVATGDTRVFVQRDELERHNTSVHVLLDCSGSMNRRQDVANSATVSLAMAISGIPKCDIAVSMFPGIGGDVSPVLRRGQPVRPKLGCFALASHGGTPLAEAMLYAAKDLAASKYERKVLIIVTDGGPNDGAAVHYMNRLLKDSVDTYAIGIQSTAVSNYFENWSVINDVKELQKALFDIAGQFLELKN